MRESRKAECETLDVTCTDSRFRRANYQNRRREELCELASKEQDPTKLIELMKEIDRLLEIKLNRLKGAPK